MANITKFERAQKFIPNLYKVGNNQMITGFVRAWAQSDEDILINVQETKNQLFVRFASAKYLDYLGSGMGVTRPTLVPLGDEQYRDYIYAAAFKPKTVRKLIYELLEIFWDVTVSHSSIRCTAPEPYNMAAAPFYLDIKADTQDIKTIKFEVSDFAVAGTATAAEVCAKINAIYGDRVTARVYEEIVSGDKYVELYTNTPGIAGSIQITGGTANVILGFDTDKIQSVEATVLEIYPKHLILKIPAVLPITGTIRSAHYFHPDATIIDPRPADIDSANPFWPGHFFYDTSLDYYISEVSCTTASNIFQGAIINQIQVDDASDFPNNTGWVYFGYGTSNMERVKYTSRMSNTILGIDPLHIFQHTWPAGSTITLLNNNVSASSVLYPRTDGSDYPIYFMDTHVAYDLMRSVLDIIKAAGVILEFDIYETPYLYQGVTGSGWSDYTPSGGLSGEAWMQPPKMLTAEWQAMVVGWGLPEMGRIWFDTLNAQLMMWDGTQAVILA